MIILLLSNDMIVSGYNSCWGTNVSGHNSCWGTNVSGHNSCWGTNVSGHKRVWVQSCMYTIMWAQMCLGTSMSRHSNVWAQSCGHNHVWAQTCVSTNVCGHKRVGAQTCLGTKRVWAQKSLSTNVSGHKRLWAQTCGHSRVGTIMYGYKRGGTAWAYTLLTALLKIWTHMSRRCTVYRYLFWSLQHWFNIISVYNIISVLVRDNGAYYMHAPLSLTTHCRKILTNMSALF